MNKKILLLIIVCAISITLLLTSATFAVAEAYFDTTSSEYFDSSTDFKLVYYGEEYDTLDIKPVYPSTESYLWEFYVSSLYSLQSDLHDALAWVVTGEDYLHYNIDNVNVSDGVVECFSELEYGDEIYYVMGVNDCIYSYGCICPVFYQDINGDTYDVALCYDDYDNLGFLSFNSYELTFDKGNDCLVVLDYEEELIYYYFDFSTYSYVSLSVSSISELSSEFMDAFRSSTFRFVISRVKNMKFTYDDDNYVIAKPTFDVTFDASGGYFIDSATSECLSTIVKSILVEDNGTMPEFEPYRDGYTFVGWDMPVDIGSPYQCISAIWRQNISSYTVTFNLAGGTRTGGGAISQTVTQGSSATAPTVTREGYDFVRWDKSFTNVQGNLTVTAIWEKQAPKTYTVTFNLYGGTRTGGGELTQQVIQGGSATAPTVTREGYTFARWDKTFTNVQSDLTITAVWNAKTFLVEFINVIGCWDGTTWSGTFPLYLQDFERNHSRGNDWVIIADYGDTIPYPIVNSGYKLYIQGEGDLSKLNNITSDIVVEVMITVEPTVEYVVEFNTNGIPLASPDQTELLVQVVEKGEDAVAPLIDTTGLASWYWDREFTNVNSNMTVTLVYVWKTYTVTYILSGGIYDGADSKYESNNDILTEKVRHGHSATPPTVTKENLHFDKWEGRNGFDNITSDVSYKAAWKANVVLNLYDDLVISYQLSEGSRVPVQVRVGHNFEGWKTSSSSEVRFTYIVEQDIELFAVWSLKHYTVTLVVDNKVFDTVNVEYGNGLNLQDYVPIKDKYVFSDWCYANDIVYDNEPVTSDFYLYAKFCRANTDDVADNTFPVWGQVVLSVLLVIVAIILIRVIVKKVGKKI